MSLPRTTVFQSAMRERMTWGLLPLERHFRQAFDEDLGQNGIYKIRNCRELDAVYPGGNIDFTCDELWSFLTECEQSAYAQHSAGSDHGFDTNHELSDLVSGILYTLGFEWV